MNLILHRRSCTYVIQRVSCVWRLIAGFWRFVRRWRVKDISLVVSHSRVTKTGARDCRQSSGNCTIGKLYYRKNTFIVRNFYSSSLNQVHRHFISKEGGIIVGNHWSTHACDWTAERRKQNKRAQRTLLKRNLTTTTVVGWKSKTTVEKFLFSDGFGSKRLRGKNNNKFYNMYSFFHIV